VQPRLATYRKLTNALVVGLSGFSALIGLFFLGWILMVVILKGMAAFSPDFFLKLPTPPGVPGGGLANAIVGTLLITLLSVLLGVPLGILGGVYLSEFGEQSKIAAAVRFCSNVLMGTPSIIVGVFIYAIMVYPLGHFSGYAGAVSLAVIMLPVVVRTTEDMLRLVPNSLRESALALGAPRWKVTVQVVFRAAKSGLFTGVLLAIARVSGETAPLLFTALNSPYWMESLSKPTANLTVTIFNYAMSPYKDWQRQAWGASLLIMMGVLFVTLVGRFYLKGRKTP